MNRKSIIFGIHSSRGYEDKGARTLIKERGGEG